MWKRWNEPISDVIRPGMEYGESLSEPNPFDDDGSVASRGRLWEMGEDSQYLIGAQRPLLPSLNIDSRISTCRKRIAVVVPRQRFGGQIGTIALANRVEV